MDEKQWDIVRQQRRMALARLLQVTNAQKGKTREELIDAIREHSSARQLAEFMPYARTLSDAALLAFTAEIVYGNSD